MHLASNLQLQLPPILQLQRLLLQHCCWTPQPAAAPEALPCNCACAETAINGCHLQPFQCRASKRELVSNTTQLFANPFQLHSESPPCCCWLLLSPLASLSRVCSP
jgi:hypothetical protein